MFSSIESRLLDSTTSLREMEWLREDLALWSWGYRKIWNKLLTLQSQKLKKSEVMKTLYDLGMDLTFGGWEDQHHQRKNFVKDPLQDEDLKSKKCFTAYQVKSMIAKTLGEYNKLHELKKVQRQEVQTKVEHRQTLQKKDQEALDKELQEGFDSSRVRELRKSIQRQKERIDQGIASIKEMDQQLHSGHLKICFGSRSKLKSLERKRQEVKQAQSQVQAHVFQTSQHQDLKTLNHLQQEFSQHEQEWKDLQQEWKTSREGWRFSNGDAGEMGGNGEIRWIHEGEIRPHLKYRWTEYVAYQRLRSRLENGSERVKIPALNKAWAVGGLSEAQSHQTLSLQDMERLLKVVMDTKQVALGTCRKESEWSVFDLDFHAKTGKKKSGSWQRQELLNALKRKQPISSQILIRTDLHQGQPVEKVYVQLAYDVEIHELEVNHLRHGQVLGIDLNVAGVGYAICGPQGQSLKDQVRAQGGEEFKPQGWIPWTMKNASNEERKAELDRMVSILLKISDLYDVASWAIENLDFSRLKKEMKTQRGRTKKQRVLKKQHNHTISTFGQAQIKQRIERICSKKGLQLRIINPKYSSVGGYVKYGFARGWGVDVAASFWIARQGALGWRTLDKELAQEEKKQQENTNPITKKEEIKNQTLNKDKTLTKKVRSCLYLKWKSESIPLMRVWDHKGWKGKEIKNFSSPVAQAFARTKPVKTGLSQEEQKWKQLLDDLGPRTQWRTRLQTIKHPTSRQVSPGPSQGTPNLSSSRKGRASKEAGSQGRPRKPGRSSTSTSQHVLRGACCDWSN